MDGLVDWSVTGFDRPKKESVSRYLAATNLLSLFSIFAFFSSFSFFLFPFVF